MANPGVAPLDPTTDVGRFRILYGDTDYVPLDPPVPGMGDYEELSDEQIETYLAAGEQSVPRAIGTYYLTLAGKAAKKSKSIKDQDLAVDLKSRAADLRAEAAAWFAQADEDDDRLGTNDVFDIFPTGARSCNTCEFCESRTCSCGW